MKNLKTLRNVIGLIVILSGCNAEVSENLELNNKYLDIN